MNQHTLIQKNYDNILKFLKHKKDQKKIYTLKILLLYSFTLALILQH